MFYDVLMQKRAERRLNDRDMLLAALHSDDDELRRQIDSDSRTFGAVLGAAAGVPSAVLATDILHDRPAKTRMAAALGLAAGGTALGAVAAPRILPATDGYIRKLRAEQTKRRNTRQQRG